MVLDEPVLVVLDRQRVVAVLRHRHLDHVAGVLHHERGRRVVELERGRSAVTVAAMSTGDWPVPVTALLERLVDARPRRTGPRLASSGSWLHAGGASLPVPAATREDEHEESCERCATIASTLPSYEGAALA